MKKTADHGALGQALGWNRYPAQKRFFPHYCRFHTGKDCRICFGIFLPRFLSKADYGLLTYVDNIRNYVMLFNGIGITQATLRFCAQKGDDEVKKGYFISSLKIGIIADIF